MIERIYILCLIIIKSEVCTITHCLGLDHEKWYALYVYLYSFECMPLNYDQISMSFYGDLIMTNEPWFKWCHVAYTVYNDDVIFWWINMAFVQDILIRWKVIIPINWNKHRCKVETDIQIIPFLSSCIFILLLWLVFVLVYWESLLLREIPNEGHELHGSPFSVSTHVRTSGLVVWFIW